MIIVDDPHAPGPDTATGQALARAKIHFKRMPKRGAHFRSADGVYWTHGPVDKGVAQVIAVGLPTPAPEDILAAFNAKFAKDKPPYGIYEMGYLQPNAPAAAGTIEVLRRGYFSVVMRRRGVSDAEVQAAFGGGVQGS